jgi:hypothetical protein
MISGYENCLAESDEKISENMFERDLRRELSILFMISEIMVCRMA